MGRLGNATASRRTVLAGGAAVTVAALWPAEPAYAADTAVGFVWDRGRFTPFDLPGTGRLTAVTGINDRGYIVGKYPDETGMYHGFVRDPRGRYTNVDVPDTLGTYVLKINYVGSIVGVSNAVSRTTTGRGAKGYLLVNGRFVTITPPRSVQTQALGINNRGVVVGEWVDDEQGAFHGFRWERGKYSSIDVPGAVATSVTDINDRDEVIGIFTKDPKLSSLRGFVLSHGRYTFFDPPDGLPFLVVNDINNRGQIVGAGVANPTDASTFRGFLLARGPGGPYTTLVPPGTSASFVGGLNDKGQAAGLSTPFG